MKTSQHPQNHLAGFQCLRCGHQEPKTFTGMLCPTCEGNLDVLYDYAAINPRNWMRERDDIFRYSALLPISDLSLTPVQRVGHTPLYHAVRAGASLGLRNLYVKDDGLNPSGSFKDRAGAVALVVARERNAGSIAAATTGNAGSSMAALAGGVNFPCAIFVPASAPPAKLAQILAFGVKVIAVRGTYDQAYDLCEEVCAQRGWFNRNTGYNPFTREGKKTCSFEIWEQLGGQAPDHLFVGTGDGNIISGIWKGFRDLLALKLIEKMPRLYASQSEKSAAVSRAVREARRMGIAPDWKALALPTVQADTLADSIAVDFPSDGLAAVRAVIETGGDAVTVSDQEILDAIPDLARSTGVFAEPAATACWAAMKRLAAAGRFSPDDKVVCVVTGSGLKDIASVRRAVGDPIAVDATMDAVLKILS
ncbi:MAG: threonine synthase [Verrucomicrobia bacterium]|nr:threonine synthase [Verrucomicrobiota bacterium]